MWNIILQTPSAVEKLIRTFSGASKLLITRQLSIYEIGIKLSHILEIPKLHLLNILYFFVNFLQISVLISFVYKKIMF